MSHPTWLEIDRSAITANCKHIIQDTGTALMAIVKADAYGHGAVEVGKAALKGGASWLGVARYNEARILRQNGIRAPILVLGMVTAEEVDEAIADDVTLTLHSLDTLELFSGRFNPDRKPVSVHLKVDSGMGRLGVFAEDILPLARQAQGTGIIHIDGIYSHLAAAEDENPLNEIQLQRFDQAVQSLESAGMRPRWVHVANSAAAFYLPHSRHDMVRVGNVVLGLRIRLDKPLPAYYRPALTWKARLAASRLLPAGWNVGYGTDYITTHDEVIGVVPAGFGDGLRRVPGNQVIIGGVKCPVVGRLCLDQMMIRLPHPYPMGEEVVIIGGQGASSQWVHDLAQLYKISQVDLTSLIHSRVPRIYR